jgi:hypothetical protein
MAREKEVINFFHPQAYLIYALTNKKGKFASSKLDPNDRSIAIHRVVGQYEPMEGISKIYNSSDSSRSLVKNAFFNLPAHKISALVPELKFFKSVGDDLIPFYFPISALGRNVASLNEPSRVGGSMVKNFSIEYQGTDPHTAPIYQKANLTLYVDNLENIFDEPPEKGYARLADLFTISIANPVDRIAAGSASVTSGDLSRPIEVTATMGYSVMDTGIFTKEEIQQIRDANITFNMNVFNHVINIQQNGSATIEIQYTARINTSLKSKLYSAMSTPVEVLARADLQQLVADDKEKSGKIDKKEKIKANLELKRKARIEKINQCREIMDALDSAGKIYSITVSSSDFAEYSLLGTLASEKDAKKKAAASGTKKDTTDKKKEEAGKDKAKTPDPPKPDFATNVGSLKKELKQVDFSVREISYVTFGDLLQAFMKKVYDTLSSAIKVIGDSSTKDGIQQLENLGLGAFVKKSESDRLKIKNVIIEAIKKMRNYKVLLLNFNLKYFAATQGDEAVKSYTMNIADVPISLPVYQKFMYNNVVNTTRNTFVVPQFLDACLRKGGLLDMAVKQFAEAGMAPSVVSASPDFTSTTFTGAKLRSKSLRKANLSPKDVPGGLKSFESTKASEDCDYYVVGQSPNKELSKNGSGNKDADAKRGIYHFEIGKNKGLLKNVSFSKIDVPYMQEQLMLNQVGMYDELRMIYNVSIDMIGNNLFIPGSKIFVDPGTIGMGNPLDKRSAAYRLGLGGYYIVHRITTSVNNGVMSTSLTCTHEAHADERESYHQKADNIPRAGGIESGGIGSPDPVPSFVSNRRISIPDYYGMFYTALLELRDERDLLVLDKETAEAIARDFDTEDSERPDSVKGVRSREKGPNGMVIYHLVNGKSVMLKNSWNTDAVTLVTTPNTVPK